jgi:hypothetical protein
MKQNMDKEVYRRGRWKEKETETEIETEKETGDGGHVFSAAIKRYAVHSILCIMH